MILGKKIGMTQVFENEKLIPVTVIEAGPNFVVQLKSDEKDGYKAVTLAYEKKKVQLCQKWVYLKKQE